MIRIAKRLATVGYRCLLVLPRRQSVGEPDEIVAVFEAALAGEIARRGLVGLLFFSLGAYLDTIVFALRTRWPARVGTNRRIPLRAQGAAAMTSILGHLRHAMRALRRTPLVSVAAVMTIALAVGLAAMTFGVIYGIAWRPLPFPGGDRLMSVELISQRPAGRVQFEAAELHAFRGQQHAFEALEGYFQRRVTLQDGVGGAQSLRAGVVTATALEHLGVPALLGRTFAAGEDFTASIHHVVLGHQTWRQHFGGRFDIVGKTVWVDGRNLEVIGVMPEEFRFPADEQLWLPMDFDWPAPDGGRAFQVFGRLAEGVDQGTAEAEARVIAQRLAAANGRSNSPSLDASEGPGLSARIVPYLENRLPPGLPTLLLVLAALVLGLLLIACANLTNLLLARAMTRRHETGLRRALGASSLEIAAQFLAEALLLSGAGTALGLSLGVAGMHLLADAATAFALPFWAELRLDPPVLVATAGLALSLAMVSGLVSAWQTRIRVSSEVLREGARSLTSRRAHRFGRGLVSMQIAISCALLLGAGLLIRSVIHAHTLDRGYDAGQVVTSTFRLSPSEYSKAMRSELVLSLLEQASSLPGAAGAAMVRSPPGTGATFSWEFELEGRNQPVDGRADGVPVSHGYFSVMGIDLVQGRDFLPGESRHGGEVAVIVNRTLAERHLGAAAVGSRLRLGPGEPWLPVVGVVEDSYIGSGDGGLGLSEAQREQIFISWGVAPYTGGTLLTRSKSHDPLALVPALRGVMSELAPSVALYEIANLQRLIDRSTWAFGVFGALFGLYGSVGLLLAVLGLYGVTAFAVGQRQREVGIRVALGAEPGAILRLVLGSAAVQLAWGAGAGMLLGYGLASSIRALLFGVGAADPMVYFSIALLLTVTGLGAAYFSARDALRVNPAQILGS